MMERREIKKIPIDEAMQILHDNGINVSKEEAEKIQLSFFQINNELHKNKNRKNDHSNHFSCLVPGVGIEPTLLGTRV